MMNQLLLVEDDQSLLEGLEYSLRKNGFQLETARTVKEAQKLLEERKDWDLLLLDVSLPDGTGFSVCERVRRTGNAVPIIFLTASDEETSIIRGLDGGGDDYITKPFRLGELCSRIRALLRRSSLKEQNQDGIFDFEDLKIDFLSNKIIRQGKSADLTGAEHRLLYLLVKNTGCTLTRGKILDALWDGNGDFVDDNTLSVYVRRLREKTEEDPSSPRHLITVRGIGYQWRR